MKNLTALGVAKTMIPMKKLTRQSRGQIQASSDPEIVNQIRHAHTDLWQIKIVGDPIDQFELMNAWLFAMARLPEPYRTKLTQVCVAHLEDWMLDRPLKSPEVLIGEMQRSLCVESCPLDLAILKGPRAAELPLGNKSTGTAERQDESRRPKRMRPPKR